MEPCSFRTCFFLLSFGALSIAATPVSRNPFSFVPSVFIQKSSEENSSHAIKACFDEGINSTNVKSGFLGPQEELSHLCQPSDARPVCQTTQGLLNYICNPVQGVQYNKVESEANSTLLAVCLAFRNETFLSKLGEVASHITDTKGNLSNNLTSNARLASFTDCEEVCNSSLRLCQIILQTLKTIVSEVKLAVVDKQLIEPPRSKSEVIMPPAAEKIPSNAPSSPSTTTDTKTTKSSHSFVESSEDKPVIQTTEKDTESKDWNPLSPDTADEETLEEMGKPDLTDDDLDDKDLEATGNKVNNDAFIGTPTKPSQSYDSESEIDEDPVNTHFIFYFLAFVAISVCGYILYQRRNRIVALVLEGRGGQARRRGRSSRSRGSSGSYHKLVNNLEEAITSHSVKNSNVVY